MSVLATLSLVAGGCLRRAGCFVLGVEAPLAPPAGQVVSLTPCRIFRQPPDRWQLAIALGELWDAARNSAGDRPVYLRGRQDPDTGATELDAVIVIPEDTAVPVPVDLPSPVSPEHSAQPA